MVLIRKTLKKTRKVKKQTRRIRSIKKGGAKFNPTFKNINEVNTVIVNHQPIPKFLFENNNIDDKFFEKVKDGEYKTKEHYYMVYVSDAPLRKDTLEFNPRLYLDGDNMTKYYHPRVYYTGADYDSNPGVYLKNVIVLYVPDPDTKDYLKLIVGIVIQQNFDATSAFGSHKHSRFRDVHYKPNNMYAILSTKSIIQIRNERIHQEFPELKTKRKEFLPLDFTNLSREDYRDNREMCENIINFFQDECDLEYDQELAHRQDLLMNYLHNSTNVVVKKKVRNLSLKLSPNRHPFAPNSTD